jgi:hypothetical protein
MTRAGRSLMIMAASAAVCFMTFQQAQAHPIDPHPAGAYVTSAGHVDQSTNGAASYSGRSARSTSADAASLRALWSEVHWTDLGKAEDTNVQAGSGRGTNPHGKAVGPAGGKAATTQPGKPKHGTNNGPSGSPKISGKISHGRGAPPHSGVGTPLVVVSSPVPTSSAPGTAVSQPNTVPVPTVRAGSIAAFPPVPTQPGSAPQGTSPGATSAPKSTPQPNDASGKHAAPATVPYQATQPQPRSLSLGLMLLVGAFGIGTAGIVMAAGHRGRRRVG